MEQLWLNTVILPPELAQLQEGWDGYGGKVPTEEAKLTARHMSLVPGGDGSLQFEIHAGGQDVEIHIAPDGKIDYVFSTCPVTEHEPK